MARFRSLSIGCGQKWQFAQSKKKMIVKLGFTFESIYAQTNCPWNASVWVSNICCYYFGLNQIKAKVKGNFVRSK